MMLLIAGLLLGFGIAWGLFWVRWGAESKQREARQHQERELLADQARWRERADQFGGELSRAREELAALRLELQTAHTDLAGERARIRHLDERLDQQKQDLLAQQARFQTEFENLATRIFDEKSRKFTEQNQLNLDRLLKPFAEKMSDLRKTVETAHVDESKQRATLGEQLRSLTELNRQMTSEANNLTQALKGQSQTQGAWGEFILETVLERSGLTKGVEYQIQQTYLTGELQRLRPDVMINLPDSRNLVIDSKLSLVAYERYCSSPAEAEKALALKSHLDSVRQHVRDLSAKKYQALYQITTPDFVLLFFPLESAFSLALQHDRELFNDAFDLNIIMVTPTTLLATLRTVSNLWKMEKQNKYALEIARKAGDLLDKFADFCTDMEKVGEQLKRTETVHGEAMKKLKTGKGNLVNRATELQKLGAKATKQLPETEDLISDTLPGV